jgi:serine/threonine protein kinase/tetratricopeptide (TPR) repeat protein
MSHRVPPSDQPTRRVPDAAAAPALGVQEPPAELAQTPLPVTAVVPAVPAPTGLNPAAFLAREEKSVASAASVDWAGVPRLPEVGTEFLGFRLIRELGRGAFGRVYLAQQGALAGRPVALKVAHDIAGESRTLAQLQHTNIVPIYSFHRTGTLQAVCMPYFGGTTLAQVVQRLGGGTNLPSSGRELKSTLNRRTTEPGMPSPLPALPGSEPALPAELAPASAADPAGWARLEGLSYVGAVLWLGEQLADGLAHAHARGILHRDLKPANVLLADDGRPMLLDFNLAEDTKLREGAAARAAIGGTIPYMSPEQLGAFFLQAGRLDERCDVFSLGVILFELLTGRHPYPLHGGTAREMIPAMITDRQRPLPPLASLNPAVSPAVDAIIRKCLAADPAERYQRAEHLREDLDRQLNSLPLKYAGNPSAREGVRKWVRRHPRLASSGTVAAVAGLLIAGLAAGVVQSRAQARELHARTQLADHRAAFRDVQTFLDDRNQSRPYLDESLAKLRAVLARYGVPDDGGDDRWLTGPDVARLPAEERDRLRADVGETFYQMAQVAHLKADRELLGVDRDAQLALAETWHAAAVRHAGDRLPRALREQEAGLAELRGDRATAERLHAEAAAMGAESPRDLFLLGAGLAHFNRQRDALPHLQKSTQLDPTDHSAWFVRGTVHLKLGQNEMAAECFSACLALRDDFAPAWLNRGVSYTRRRFYDQALADYERAIRLDPALTKAHVARAETRENRGDWKGAEADYTAALAAGAAEVRLYFRRAAVRDRLGDAAGAKADREKGLSLTPVDDLSWVGRAELRAGKDPKGALADVEEALKVNDSCVEALQMKAHILAERLDRPEEAEKALDRAVELNPDYVPARAGRGVVHARRGKRDAALRDAREALLRDTLPPNLYQVGCIYALTSAADKGHPEDKREAFRLLFAALRTGFGLDIVDTDRDLDPLRKDEEFKRLVAGARAFYQASKQ